MRYTELELPKIAYIPGQTERPSSKSYKLHDRKAIPITDCRGDKNIHLLYGIDLFNAGFYWEAHEAWEDLWRVETNREFRDVIQGLIQITGGAVKVIQENSNGVTKLWSSALNYLKVGTTPICEVDMRELLKEVRSRLDNSKKLMGRIDHLKIDLIPRN
jgi:predicted metal-dependent hydrolase